MTMIRLPVRFPRPRAFALTAAGFCCALLVSQPRIVSAQGNGTIEFPAPSSHQYIKQRLGTMDVEVDYSRPNKNGRQIFGGLVPWNAVWRTGANASTKITFSTAVNVEGETVQAGTYGLYTIPNADEWTVIIYKDPKQWGAYEYKQSEDLLRVKVKPQTLGTPVETFTIGFEGVTEGNATMYLDWDQTRVPVRLAVDTTNRMKTAIQRQASAPDATPQFFAQAANYYLTHDLDPRMALKWIDMAIDKTPDAYAYYGRRASILVKMGDKRAALESAEKGLAIAKAHQRPDDPEALDSLTRLVESLR